MKSNVIPFPQKKNGKWKTKTTSGALTFTLYKEELSVEETGDDGEKYNVILSVCREELDEVIRVLQSAREKLGAEECQAK